MNVERQYDERGLKRYARVITGYVATHAVSGQDNPYTVEMETLKGLKVRQVTGPSMGTTGLGSISGITNTSSSAQLPVSSAQP